MLEKATEKDATIMAVDRALEVLVYIYNHGKPVHISEMAREMGLHKSTVYRVLFTLEKKGFITKSPENDTYWLGMKLFALGSCVQEKMSITNLVRPYAKSLFYDLQEVVNLSVLEIHSVKTPKIVVLQKEESDTQLLKVNPSVGKFSDCHSSAAGKCLLAYSNEVNIDEMKPFELKKYTEHTLTDWNSFIDAIHKAKEVGYALDEDEREYGLTCIGAPILDRSGNAIAALSIAGPSARVKKDMQYKIDQVMRTADLISKQYV